MRATAVPNTPGRPARLVGIHFEIELRRRTMSAGRGIKKRLRLPSRQQPLYLKHHGIRNGKILSHRTAPRKNTSVAIKYSDYELSITKFDIVPWSLPLLA